MSNEEDICTAIIKTLCWFDVFDYPLTKEEVWRYGLFIGKCEQTEVETGLASLLAQNKIGQTEIFYHLEGRTEIIDERRRRHDFSEKKFMRALSFVKIFRFIPSIRFIALGNQIGSRNLRAEGDIDLLVISEPGTIWTTRFITTFIVKLLGARPKEGKSKDTICLSFYATSDALNLKPIADADNLYFYYWLAFLAPLYNRGGMYEKLMQENFWVNEMLPNFFPLPGQQSVNKKSFIASLMLPLYILEGPLKKLQLKILPKELKEMANQDSRVVITDQILKLHSNDRRQEFQDRYRARLKQAEVL